MIAQGAIAEVEALLSRGLNPNLPVMRAIGVREIAAYLIRRCVAGGDHRCGPAGDAPLRQAPVHLVRPPAAPRVAAVRRGPDRSCAGTARSKRLGARHGLPQRRRRRPSPARGQARRDPRLRQPGPRPGAESARQRDRRRRRAARRFRKQVRGGSVRAGNCAPRGSGRLSGRRHDARARRNPRRALPRDRGRSAPRRRARLQPRPVGALRLRRAARRPRRLPARAQRARHRAAFALPAGQRHDLLVGGGAGQERQCPRHRPRLRPRDRQRPRRADRLQLRRGSRSRSIQRAGGGVGRRARSC